MAVPRFLFPTVALLASLHGCAGSTYRKDAARAERAGHYDEAVALYTRAASEKPDDANLARELARAKLRASAAHALEAARRMSAGDLQTARNELEVALTLNPTDVQLARELEELKGLIEEKGEEAERHSIASLKRRVGEAPFGQLSISPSATDPAGFVFRDASLRDILLSLGTLAGVNVVFDRDFVDDVVSIDLEDATFEEAFRSLCTITRNFYRVEANGFLTIVPDTPAKRRDYEQQVSRTFYLSSADLKETIDLLRIVLGARRIAPLTATNALTIVDAPERVKAAEMIISSLDKSRSEVIVEMEILEVDRTRMVEYGIQLRSAGEEGIQTSIFPGDTTLDVPPFASDNVFVAGLPGAVLSLLRADSDTRVLANPQLRAVDGESAQAEFGERVPVPITTFTPIATGGVPQQPVTTFQYENIGVNILVTPRVHHDNEISIALELRLSTISGTGFGGLPTFGNRSVNTVLRLADGETSLLAGLINEEERTSLNGTPGLANVPLLGRIFSANRKEVRESDIVLTMTPRIIRRTDVTIGDLLPHIIEGLGSGGLLYEPPQPLPQREPEVPQEGERRPPGNQQN
ncbi:MAG TPA: secretin N-terminal domain-containing protein [Vicinamibacteria bacterium]|nr:secretin N-terminal domain-containing protein [Vicinamibacteria bacterium]